MSTNKAVTAHRANLDHEIGTRIHTLLWDRSVVERVASQNAGAPNGKEQA